MSDESQSFRPIGEIMTDTGAAFFAGAFPDAGIDTSAITTGSTANPEFGDYQCNDCMALAKQLKRSPRDIATAVVDYGKAQDVEHIESIEVAGPGFINYRIKDEWLSDYLERVGKHSCLGVPSVGEGRTLIMDYSSPNVAKPMHIGHIRSTIIGNALDRLHRFLGYRVIADNHIGDWGTQFGIIIHGYRHLADPEALKSHPVEELERIYVESYARTKEDESWLTACREELVKLQGGDAEDLALWQEFVDLSLKEFDRIYGRLGVSFDTVRGESHYHDQLQETVDLLTARDLLTESEGAQVVFLEEEGLPVCIVRKSDGGFNYATTDLATVACRIDEYKPDKIIYVTDERQQLHFRQIFAISARLGYDVTLEHVWFGLMRLPEATFSTREGNVIKLEKLLDEAESRAWAMVKESSPNMPELQQKEVARAVGIGAIKYMDLSQSPQTTVTFTWEKALALDGNSGPYLQYACARIASVQDKYAERFPDADLDQYPIVFSEPVERALAMKLVRFSDVVVRAAHGYKPSAIAEYLYDLAQTYSTFYQNVPFLKAEEGLRESRVKLCGLTAAILRKGLELLGIDTPERI